jgi:hypothetical protein
MWPFETGGGERRGELGFGIGLVWFGYFSNFLKLNNFD